MSKIQLQELIEKVNILSNDDKFYLLEQIFGKDIAWRWQEKLNSKNENEEYYNNMLGLYFEER